MTQWSNLFVIDSHSLFEVVIISKENTKYIQEKTLQHEKKISHYKSKRSMKTGFQ